MSEQRIEYQTSSESDAHARAFELLISRLLQIGVIISLLMIVFGASLTFVHHPSYRTDPHELQNITRPGAIFPHSLPDVARGVVQLHGQSVAAAGLLLLIGTPVMRVVVSIIAFALQRDWAYTLITALVLSLLVLSFILGRAAG